MEDDTIVRTIRCEARDGVILIDGEPGVAFTLDPATAATLVTLLQECVDRVGRDPVARS